MANSRRVVITGLGVAAPTGLGIERVWDGLLERRCGLARIECFDPSALPCQLGGELPEFKLGDYIAKTYRKSVKVMSRDIQIAVVCAYRAVRDAGLATKCIIDRSEADGASELASDRFGANIGAGLICADLHELAGALSTATGDDGVFDLKKWGTDGMGNLTPLWLLKFLPNMLACHVTIVHDAQGPSNTITCGEASSHLAIGEAFRTIARGDADVCICGGAESKMNPMAAARAQVMGYTNTDSNDDPEGACLPFGARRRGMVPAEGGGLVIIEALAHAQARGARIYAELVGFGAGSDIQGWTKPAPSGRGVALALSKALRDADTTVDAIDLLVPFGTGLPEHDAAEMTAWNEVFGAKLDESPALMTHGGIGINGAGSGAIDFALAVKAVHQRMVPPSFNGNDLDPACRFRFVQNEPIDAPIAQAISVAHAIGGGQAAALVIRRFEE